MVDKVLLAKCESQGNLRSGKQSYYVYYYQNIMDNGRVMKLDKVVLELVAPSSNGEDVLKSYFMVDPANVRLLIMDLFKAYYFFKKQRGDFNEHNLMWWVNDLDRENMKIAKEALYE